MVFMSSSRLCGRGVSESGRQKFGILLSQSVQSCRSTENDRIRAAMAIVDGANSIDVVSGKCGSDYANITRPLIATSWTVTVKVFDGTVLPSQKSATRLSSILVSSEFSFTGSQI